MAHYALLDENNIVVQVITGVDENELIEDINPETWYGKFHNMKCVRTSYWTRGNQHELGGTPFRGNYAGIGYTYDKDADIFIPPKPFPSWKLNYQTCSWDAPTQPPTDGDFFYFWSEHNQQWVESKYPRIYPQPE
jgi:hypothetical protein